MTFDNNTLSSLTVRELQILPLIALGLSNKQIARQLSIHHGTIKVHIHNMFQKLKVENRVALAVISFQYNTARIQYLSPLTNDDTT